MKKLLIIIPTYNEKKNITEIITEIFQQKDLDDFELNILVVDDNSPDGTVEAVERIKTNNNNLFVLKRTKDRGLGKSYIAGINWGLEKNYNYFLLMDADGSHLPEYIPEFIKYLNQDYDYILGSRYLKGVSVVNWSITRLFISYSANKFVRTLLGMNIRDATAGYKAFTRNAIKKINPDKIKSTGYAFHFETTFLAFKKGCRIKEFPIIFIERHQGRSKLSKRIMFESFLKVFSLRLKSWFGRI